MDTNVSYKIRMNSGVQFRFDPLSNAETRINPIRATRPMAIQQSSSNSSNLSFPPSLSPSMSETRVIEYISSDLGNHSLHPTLYRSREPSNFDHLTPEFQELITNFISRNPFCPPEKLIHSVIEVPSNVLKQLNPGPHIYPGGNSVGSSIHNVYLAQSIGEFRVGGGANLGCTLASDSIDLDNNSKDENINSSAINFVDQLTNVTDSSKEVLFSPDLSLDNNIVDDNIILEKRENSDSIITDDTLIEPSLVNNKSNSKFDLLNILPMDLSSLSSDFLDPVTPLPLPLQPLGSYVQTDYNVLSLGEATLFMNLFPFASGHAVITNSQCHYVSLKDFTLRAVRDSLSLCIEFIKACARVAWEGESYQSNKCKGGEGSGEYTMSLSSSSSQHCITQHDNIDANSNPIRAPVSFVWPVILWNYLPPSAGSIIHPHWQCFCEPSPFPVLLSDIERQDEFFQKQLEKNKNNPNNPTLNYTQSLLTKEMSLSPSKDDAISSAKNIFKSESADGSVVSMLRSRYIGHIPIDLHSNYFPFNTNASGVTLCNNGGNPNPSYLSRPSSIASEIRDDIFTEKNIPSLSNNYSESSIPGLSSIDLSGCSSKVGVDAVIPAGQHVFILAPFAPRVVNEVFVCITTLKQPANVTNGIISLDLNNTSNESHLASGKLDVDHLYSNVSDIAGINPTQQHALALAITSVLRFYDAIGVGSFNMCSFSGPAVGFKQAFVDAKVLSQYNTDSDLENDKQWYSNGVIPPEVIRAYNDHNVRLQRPNTPSSTNPTSFSLPSLSDTLIDNVVYLPPEAIGYSHTAVFKFMSRPNPTSLYTNDSGPTERWMDSCVINSAPEEYSETFRSMFLSILAGID